MEVITVLISTNLGCPRSPSGLPLVVLRTGMSRKSHRAIASPTFCEASIQSKPRRFVFTALNALRLCHCVASKKSTKWIRMSSRQNCSFPMQITSLLNLLKSGKRMKRGWKERGNLSISFLCQITEAVTGRRGRSWRPFRRSLSLTSTSSPQRHSDISDG